MEVSGAFSNATSYLPSPADLLMVLPRLFSKASSLGDLLRNGGSVIAEPTQANLTNRTIVTTVGHFVQESVAAAAEAVAAEPADELGMFQALKNISSFFGYVTSKWAIATFAFAIILNRTHFYASSRVPCRSIDSSCALLFTSPHGSSSCTRSRASSRHCDARPRQAGLTCSTAPQTGSLKPTLQEMVAGYGGPHLRCSSGKPRSSLARLQT